MGKKGKERAKERRQQRLEEISKQREIPYSPSQRFHICPQPIRQNACMKLFHVFCRWWTSDTVAVVTGANRGIGFEIARQLAAYGLCVVLTSRDVGRGQAAADALREEGLEVESHQLDVTDAASVEDFAKWVVLRYGGIDVLVNNAGVNFNTGSDNSVEFAENVVATNYFGTKRMIETMIPIMKPSPFGARILNVSSRLGRANGRRNRVGDATLREQLLREDYLSEELVDGMITKFLDQVKQGSWSSSGWPQIFTDYSISKLAVNAYTQLMARRLSDRSEGQKIYINCVCPGWVKTAMTGWAGNMSPEEGADTGVWVVLLPHEPAITGKFFAERREIRF